MVYLGIRTHDCHLNATIDCTDLSPLIHLGARFYLSTTLHTISFRTDDGSTNRVLITPLSIFHVPCNTSFDTQETGIGHCYRIIEFSLPIFQTDQFTYVPWSPASNDTTFELHYNSLSTFPPSHFDHKTLEDIDNAYSILDGKLTSQRQAVNASIERD